MKTSYLLYTIISLGLLINCNHFALSQNVSLNVKLKGIDQCNVSVYSISESNNIAIAEKLELKKTNGLTINIPAKYLPGEFVVYFEYYDKSNASKPQTAEKMLIINKQNIDFSANPKYINNPDSSYFNKDEVENITLTDFAIKTMTNLDMLDLIQNFLLKYDNQESDFYKAGIQEYNLRRIEHNNWIDSQIKKYKELYCSNMFYFYYVPDIDWNSDKYKRRQSQIDNYFTGMDFSNKEIIRISYLKSWMDNYVNKYVELATNQNMITDLFVDAGHKAIEKAKTGDPEFYGWMVDYFFNGYESMNIQSGITMLEQYTKDPNCITYKRKEIEKRVTGIQTLKEGSGAPDFSFTDENGKTQNFLKYATSAKYKLVIFWSADCEHCEEIVNELYAWHKNNKSKIDIFALSLDESDTEIPKWEIRHKQLTGWNHILTKGGINSKEAESYYILSTPTLFLVDSKTNKIISSPDSFNELMLNIEYLDNSNK